MPGRPRSCCSEKRLVQLQGRTWPASVLTPPSPPPSTFGSPLPFPFTPSSSSSPSPFPPPPPVTSSTFSQDPEARAHRQQLSRLLTSNKSRHWARCYAPMLFNFSTNLQSWESFFLPHIHVEKWNWGSVRLNKRFITGLNKRTENSILNLARQRLLGTLKAAVWMEWQRWKSH